MTRQVRDAALETRNARRRLKIQGKPYWKAMEQGLHIGYRKLSSGGTWVVRRLNELGRYRECGLGNSDDFQDADGVNVLNFRHAQEAARKWAVTEKRREQWTDEGNDESYTVADAMRDYLSHYSVEGKGLSVTRSSVNAHILPSLGQIKLTQLTTKRITVWRNGIAASPALLRTSKTAKERNTRKLGSDAESIRRRRATANRILTILKAALNYAWREGKITTDNAWRKVPPFESVDAPVVRYLTEPECKRLVNACSKDFRQIVLGAIFTGCRYGELAALKSGDFNPDSGTVAIRASKAGKPRHVILTEEGKAFFETATAGKLANELIFARDDGSLWKESHQKRRMEDACKTAKIVPAVSFHVLRHTHGSLLAMQGVPMPVIAKQLGHTDTRMTEKHYAHLSPSYVADTIRQSFPSLGIVEKSRIKVLKSSKRSLKGT